MAMMDREERRLQRNNGSPRGYGQPNQGRSPESEDRLGYQQGEFDVQGTVMDDGAQQMRQYTPQQSSGGSTDYNQQPVRGYPEERVSGLTSYNSSDQLLDALRRSLSGNSQIGNRSPYQQPQEQIQQAPQQEQRQGIQGLAQGQVGLGPMQQYGTGNIEGVGGLRTGDYMGQLEGFNTQGWGTGERGTESFKNAMGRIMSRYDVSQPGAAQALMSDPEFRQLAPNAQLVQHPNGDMIDFGDGNGPVDVIRGAVAGGSGAAWQWGTGGGQSNMLGGGPPGPGAELYGLPFMEQFSPGQGQAELQQAGFDPSQSQQLLQFLMSLTPQSVGQETGVDPSNYILA